MATNTTNCTEIPDILKNDDFRFVKVSEGEKTPFENNWPTEANYHYSDPELKSHLQEGENYALLGGEGDVLLIDADKKEVIEAVKTNLPDTLSWWRGDENRRTFVFRCPDMDGSLRIEEGKNENIGDIIHEGKVAVAPNSTHPTGATYRFYKEREIATVNAYLVKHTLSQWLKEEVDVTSSEEQYYDNSNTVYEILEKSKYPEEKNVSHPFHGSDTGHNFRVDEGGETFRCWRHGVTGNLYHLIGIKEGIISCGDWKGNDIPSDVWEEIFTDSEEMGLDTPDVRKNGSSKTPSVKDYKKELEAFEKKLDEGDVSPDMMNKENARLLARTKTEDEFRYKQIRNKISNSSLSIGDFEDLIDKVIKESKRELLQNDIFDLTGIEVIGETKESDVILYNDEKKKTRRVPRIDDLAYNDALQLAGDPFEENVARRSSNDDPRISYSKFKETVVKTARERKLSTRSKYGQGIYQMDRDTALIVSGGEAGTLDLENGEHEKIDSPLTEEAYVHYDLSKEWFAPDNIFDRYEHFRGNNDQCRDRVEELLSLITEWNWKNGFVDAFLATGGILSTLVQHFINLRPHFALIGEKGSGKSLFFEEVLEKLFPSLCQVFDSGSTEAGIRQTLMDYSTGAVDNSYIVRDEFEKLSGYQREQIMKWLRTSSRGGTTTKGTQNQKHSLDFKVHHSFWIGTTEFGGSANAPDLDRFLRLYLTNPEKHIDLPSKKELEELGRDLVAISLAVLPEVKQKIEKYKKGYQNEENGIDITGRMIEIHAVPFAFLDSAIGDNNLDGFAQPDFQELIEERKSEATDVSRQADVISKILTTKLDARGLELTNKNTGDYSDNAKLTIGQLLDYYDEGSEEIDELLERNGLKVVKAFGGTRLFFHPKTVQRYCLDDTQYKKKDIRDYLQSCEETEENDRQYINGSQKRGVSIPLTSIDKRFDTKSDSEIPQP